MHKLKNGRTISAGTGRSLTFTNLLTNKSLTLPSNGSVEQVTTNPDGTTTHSIEGHTILILFPTDTPAGPSTTLIVGRAVFTADKFSTFTVKSISGRTVDICAALA
ncbi:MAG: hypothetical protein QOC80_1389 [Frankiaceae bacterium]|nr:hypothetical protein [Frankiaceae bacterium]